LSHTNLNHGGTRPVAPVYWRVEGSLLELTTTRPIAFFSWNSQTFASRQWRRSLVLFNRAAASVFVCGEPQGGDAIVHAVLRGITRTGLICSGRKSFQYSCSRC